MDDEAADDQGEARSSPWLWISGLLAIVILGLAGFLVFKFLTPSSPPAPQQVVVPNLVGSSYEAARTAAEKLGLKVARAGFEASDQPDGTVLRQDPAAGGSADPGSTIELRLALGDQTAAVPDLRGKGESDALNLIATAKLTIGTRTEAFDSVIPAGAVVSQDPGAGLIVTQGQPVDYVVSKGPEPSPSPSPSPSPTDRKSVV